MYFSPGRGDTARNHRRPLTWIPFPGPGGGRVAIAAVSQLGVLSSTGPPFQGRGRKGLRQRPSLAQTGEGGLLVVMPGGRRGPGGGEQLSGQEQPRWGDKGQTLTKERPVQDRTRGC